LGYSFNNVPYRSILYQLVTCLFKPWKIYGEGGTHYFFLNMIGDIPRNILSPSKKPRLFKVAFIQGITVWHIIFT